MASDGDRRSLGETLSLWVDVVVGLVLVVSPSHVATTGVPGGTLAGVLLLFLGGYNSYRHRTAGRIEPTAAALGGLIGVWLLAVSLEVAPTALLRRTTLAAGALVVIANAAGYRAARKRISR